VVILGPLQRGGAASAFDRMVVIRGMEITSIPLGDALGSTRTVPDDLVRVAELVM